MKRKAYGRGERKEMILDVFYSMVGDGKEPYMTAYQMAKTLGVNSAQHIRNILDEMVLEDTLTFVVKPHRPGVTKKVYCPVPLLNMAWQDSSLKILFKVNGKVVK
jgi:hypothetical protein